MTGNEVMSGESPSAGRPLQSFARRPAPSKTVKIVIGGEARVSLLPPEVRANRRGRRARGRLMIIGVVVTLLMGAAHFASAWQAGQAERVLANAQSLTTELLVKQAKFGELRRVTGSIDDTQAAVQFGESTEIDWPAWLRALRVILPESVTIETLTIDASSPLSAYSQSPLPLQPERVATVVLSLTSATIPEVSQVLTAVRSVPGYTDAQPGLVARTATGSYQVGLTVHIDASVYVNGPTEWGG
ncbi:hypothetical protein [Cryobacterium sp. PH31-O1]|uniref:hypothetical protein n=1 Tax=Cryobacterium sp. PH31-O1 TaxID=3046306 RepID=UPI0024B8A414|nr:hypothetical protein [Cryobacterium sp. PH31-O1]MDJ0337801.1 hypothetical protein [Cryobacterium sp. PH31-O1]